MSATASFPQYTGEIYIINFYHDLVFATVSSASKCTRTALSPAVGSSLAAPDFAFCLRLLRRGDVTLSGEATKIFVKGVVIVAFFTMMNIASVSDNSAAKKIFNVSSTRPSLLRTIDADVNNDCMAGGARAQGVNAL